MAKRKGSLGDAMKLMEQIRAQEPPVAVEPEPLPQAPEPVPAKALKQKISLYLDRDLIERARGAVAWAQMRGEEPDSISGLMNHAMERELGRLLDVLKPDTGDFPALGKGRKGRPPKD